MDRPLRIEVLINSPGPHDEVRIRQPFLALQQSGVDCRLHEKPFRFSECIRPHSLVIWQRPLPASWERQIEHLQWLRERGCLLLTEWDDHPSLFPAAIQQKLMKNSMAPLVGCHAIHGSSAALAAALRTWNPLTFVFENGIRSVPSFQRSKHETSTLRVFIGNQNREDEHRDLVPAIRAWASQDPQLTVVIVADHALANHLRGVIRCEQHPMVDYSHYRELLASCQIALLPLRPGSAQRCKTVIKWAEASAESVAVVAGPELYNSIENVMGVKTCSIASDGENMIKKARELTANRSKRLEQVLAAHQWVKKQWTLEQLLPQRLTTYQNIWDRRHQLDKRLVERLGEQVPLLHQADF